MDVDSSREEWPPEELADRIERGEAVSVLDVRNRDEVDAWCIDGPGVDLTHVPHVEFVSAGVTGDVAELVDPEQAYLVVCPRGEASDEVANSLRDAGVDAVNLSGGMEGWANVYRERELPSPAPGVDAVQFRRPATGCLAYALVAGDEALLVDPLRAFTDRYVESIERCDASIEFVLDTHLHADHVSGLRSLVASTGAVPVLSATAADRGVTHDVQTVDDGDRIPIADATVDVLATPGHTTGSISLRCGDLLLSGDALFLDGVGRPDLESGASRAHEHARVLHATLTERLAPLPDEILVAPGHYVPGATPAEDGTYTARLGSLRRRLPAFDATTETFVDAVLEGMGPRPANFEKILEANLGYASLDDAAAFELELGPNNCAVSG